MCLCGLMAMHTTSFPSSSLLKGGKGPVRPCSTLALWHLEDVHHRLRGDALKGVEPCRFAHARLLVLTRGPAAENFWIGLGRI
jgi:hypothetical protein